MSVNRSAWWQGDGPSMIEPLSLMSGCQSDEEEEEAIQQTLLLNQGWLGCRYADCNAIYQCLLRQRVKECNDGRGRARRRSLRGSEPPSRALLVLRTAEPSSGPFSRPQSRPAPESGQPHSSERGLVPGPTRPLGGVGKGTREALGLAEASEGHGAEIDPLWKSGWVG